ncbi:MAG TPA: PSD1 and planctomycete cytochrome C domain-containing protein [Terriglobales bacterium]
MAVRLGWIPLDPRSGHEVRFSRDIRPILNQNCVPCHGGVRQKNNVSFIFREEALGKGKSGKTTIVPGKPDESELIARVTSTDPEVRMPYHAPPLPPQQITLLRRWIKEGARWEDHWAFVPPKAQPLPSVKRVDWAHRPLDRFILARLEKESLEPSPEADKASLLRRVSFDLTGLPPTPEEQAAFQADASPDAYEKQVDRLLTSPRYGERWAALWLDLARYADTKGYESDQERPGVWPYRDWVINAFNRNLPYDQFVIEQLGGDLLPNATFEDQVATSFQRQTPVNDEGGTDDEEFRLVAVMDRVATTWAVLNGVTMNCVQCHSHPYDPIRHADYYKSLAFFNTSVDADLPDDRPVLRVPKEQSRYAEAAEIQQKAAKLIQSVVDLGRQAEEQERWKPLPITAATVNESLALQWDLTAIRRALKDLDHEKLKAKEKASRRKDLLTAIAEVNHMSAKAGTRLATLQIHDGGVVASAKTPGKSVYELVAKPELPVLTALRIEVQPANYESARHTPEDGFIVDRTEAWVVRPDGGQTKIAFRCFLPDSEADLRDALARAVELKERFSPDAGARGFAANPSLFRTHWTIGIPTVPLRLAPGSRIKVQLTQTQTVSDKPALVRRAYLSASGNSRWTVLARDHTFGDNLAELEKLSHRLAKLPSVPLPVMIEQPAYEQRTTLEFDRGNFLTKMGAALVPDVPALFPKFPTDQPRNRLTLAKWFFAPQQPLTARVAVNRYWEQLFGTGIVETQENFGSVGEEPSHPELLDWLALHFQNDLHWDMKALLRELVTSATYRQSARTTQSLNERDPRNRLLAHGPQQRLTAEMVRDQALLASGLLSSTMGGPPVMPPQPSGVWNSVYNESKWVDAKGPNRYRRAIYTYIKRTSGYPSFLTFDASDHDVTLARRTPTNTPLQALVTLNDPVYQEASEALARRMIKAVPFAPGGSPAIDLLDARLTYGAQLVLSRTPTAGELGVLRTFHDQALIMPATATAKESAVKLHGKSNQELAALTAVASILLNLDAAMTR